MYENAAISHEYVASFSFSFQLELQLWLRLQRRSFRTSIQQASQPSGAEPSQKGLISFPS